MNQNNFPKGGAITCIVGYSLELLPLAIVIILGFAHSIAAALALIIVLCFPLAFSIAGLIVSCLALKNPKIRISLWVLAIFSWNLIAFIGGIVNHATRPKHNPAMQQFYQQ